MVKYEDTLKCKFPQIAEEWDYKSNADLKPEDISAGSHRAVWWICKNCGNSYYQIIYNRTSRKSKKCPICQGRKIKQGYNSLKAKYPTIVEREWDYALNTKNPDLIAPHTKKKYWWLCPNGHESYLSCPNNKVIGNGGNCPKCSHQKISSETSLQSVNPKLAAEWHPTKNGALSPSNTFANSNKRVWWKCPVCGFEWTAKVNNRNINKRGCPNCAKGRQSSIPEQLIYKAVKHLYPDAINRFKLDKDEIDVFIPSKHIGFEYDGGQFHTSKKLKRDIKKSERISKKKIKLYRFREMECPDMNTDSCIIKRVRYSSEHIDLQNKIVEVLTEIYGHPLPVINFPHFLNEAKAELNIIPYDESFEAYILKKEKEDSEFRRVALWDCVANAPLTPLKVKPFSEKVVSWVCPNNSKHKWKNTVKSVSLGYGCNKCSQRCRYTTETWIEKANEVHHGKYDYSKVNFVDSKQKILIICPIHGAFEQTPSEHLSGKGCKYCAHQAFHPKESLAARYPELAAQWDYERNDCTGFTPETIGVNSKKKFYWHCTNGLNHSFISTIAYRVSRNSGCAVCHGKQVLPELSFGAKYPKLVKEWCDENEKTPFEVTPASEYKALWKCPNPNHPPYRCFVGSRTRLNVGCVYCNPHGKKYPKDFEDEIRSVYPNIKMLSPFIKTSERVQCECLYCGRIWSPFPNNLKKSGCTQCKNKVQQ